MRNKMKLTSLSLTVLIGGLVLLNAACSSGSKPTEQKAAALSATGATTKLRAAELFDHSAFDKLLMARVNEDGWVDYPGLQRDRAQLNEYLTTLAAAKPETFPADVERLAFWINAYNAFTLADVLDDVFHKAKGVKEVSGFFDRKKHQVAGAELTLDEIEKHGRDLKDPRLHFAVVCASTSCPKLPRFAFTGAALDEQLTHAVRGFLADPARGLRVDKGSNQLYLSPIFKWYAGDFTMSSSLIARVKAEVSGSEVLDYVKQSASAEAVQFISEKKPKVKYLDYDWSLNAQETHQ